MMNTIDVQIGDFVRCWKPTEADFFRQKKPRDRLQNTFYHHLPPIDFRFELSDKMHKRPEDVRFARPGRITLIYRNNVSRQHRFITPWIAIHRAFHMFQINITDTLSETMSDFNAAMQILATAYGTHNPNIQLARAWDILDCDLPTANSQQGKYFLDVVCADILTMRSARKKQLSGNTEVVCELFAQYVLTGKVTLNAFPERIGTADDIRKRNGQIDHREVEKLIQSSFDKLIPKLSGKVFAF